VFTRVYDIASGMPWPPAIGARVRRDAFTDEWTGREADLRQREQVTRGQPIYYGQSARFVDRVRPAADVLRSISDDAERILRDRPATLLG
jgi:nitronate monooxygenase